MISTITPYLGKIPFNFQMCRRRDVRTSKINPLSFVSRYFLSLYILWIGNNSYDTMPRGHFWLFRMLKNGFARFLPFSVMADLNGNKRKDISPKMENFGKKKDRREVIVVSDDKDEVSVAKGGSFVRKLLQSQQSDDENLIKESTTAAVKNRESDYESY